VDPGTVVDVGLGPAAAGTCNGGAAAAAAVGSHA